jgi:hypothetical protein
MENELSGARRRHGKMAKASIFSRKSERKIPSALPMCGLKENIEAFLENKL